MQSVTPGRSPWKACVAVAVAVVVVAWTYWTTLAETALIWAHEPQYSHGYLVPVFALALLWFRRDRLAGATLSPSAWGVPLLAVGILLRAVGTACYLVWFDRISLVPCLAGLCLMIGGTGVFRWVWPAVAFLSFMVPLPYVLEVMVGGPLQRVATTATTFALQTLGYPALAEGTVILLNEANLNIVEACSGLRMLVIFFALSTAVAMVVHRPLWEKMLIVASAIPIAVVVNVIRITATGVLYDSVSSEAAKAVSHDLAGWLMMPLGLLFLQAELSLLKRLLITPLPGAGRFGLAVAGPAVVGRPRRQPWKRAPA